jgi:mRNA interferase RelE/StbE
VTARYRIELTRDALRALAKLDKPVRRRIQGAIDRLAGDPRPAGMIASRRAPGAFRIRVGDHRLIDVLHDDQLLIVVIDIGHRRDIYRDVDLCLTPARRAAPLVLDGLLDRSG